MYVNINRKEKIVSCILFYNFLFFLNIQCETLPLREKNAPTQVKDKLKKMDQRLPVEEKKEAVDIEEELQEIKKESVKKDDRVLFTYNDGKNKVGVSLKIRPEAFYSRSLQLFSPSKLDQVIYAQSTFDLKVDANLLGGSLKSILNLRHKSIWGDPNTIARTTKNPIKIADDVTGEHIHFLGKQIFWMREGWIDISLNDAFCFDECRNRHNLTLGAFSFKLGRGIALGDAYAVTPGLLGFYSNNVVDQYAYGLLLHGDAVKDLINYDVYLAILEDLSDNFENVNEKIYESVIGNRRSFRASRGFGKLNYILAGRLLINLLDTKKDGRSLVFEPYILYNRNPEQDVEFPSDAKSKLITLGYGLEYINKKWEFGFEFAQNFGAQTVRCWDRNRLESRRDPETAAITLFYSDIRTENPVGNPGAPRAKVTNEIKKIVDKSEQSVALNGKQISTDPVLYNDINRFRPQYKNDYLGFMFVTDASYQLRDNLKIAATAAIATGDEDPNVDLDDPLDSEVDGNFRGFIGLQEIYSGKRVTSLFVLNKSISRPLSVPSNDIPEEDPFAQNVSGFTNLIYFGVGLDWTPTWCKKQMSIKPAILSYWLEHPSKKFDRKKNKTIDQLASTYLGTEINTWFEIKLLDNLKGFIVTGLFFPGTYFKDVEGKPLNRTQREILNFQNDTGIRDNRFPLLDHHISYILNWGFEYLF